MAISPLKWQNPAMNGRQIRIISPSSMTHSKRAVRTRRFSLILSTRQPAFPFNFGTKLAFIDAEVMASENHSQ